MNVPLSRSLGRTAVAVIALIAVPSSLISCGSTTGPRWHVVSSEDSKLSTSSLHGVAAVSAKDVWAVGGQITSAGVGLTLVEHWDGGSWQVYNPSPSPGSIENLFYGVAAASHSDVRAVGFYQNTGGPTQTLVAYWDGTGWYWYTTPSPGLARNELDAVAVDPANTSDVWAVGQYRGASGPYQTLVEHFNGTSWINWLPIPSPGSAWNRLLGVAAVSPTDAWAVGFYQDTGGPFHALILNYS